MKRGLFFLLSIIIGMPFYESANANPNGVPLSEYTFQSNELLLRKPALTNLVILPHGPFSEKDAMQMIKNLEKVDENILNLAVRQNIRIILFTGSITDQDGLKSLLDQQPKGYIDSNTKWESIPGMSINKTVYAKLGHSEFGKGHGSISLELHEIAHAIDKYVFNMIRNDPEFLSIWKSEVNILFPGQTYFKSFSEEYFAEAFAMFYLDEYTKKLLETRAPQTYKYILSLEKDAAVHVE